MWREQQTIGAPCVIIDAHDDGVRTIGESLEYILQMPHSTRGKYWTCPFEEGVRAFGGAKWVSKLKQDGL